MRKYFKSFSERFRDTNDEYLLVNKQGEYQYRNPDSAFVHSFDTFRTKEDALEYIDRRIPKGDLDDWKLYKLVS